MIVGIGTDIVQIPRIDKLLKLHKQRFVRRILSENEISKMVTLSKEQHSSFIAKRFAAKEAISKALGIGIGRGFGFRDISILNDNLGKPSVNISSPSFTEYQQIKIHLSISDDYPISVAFAIASTV